MAGTFVEAETFWIYFSKMFSLPEDEITDEQRRLAKRELRRGLRFIARWNCCLLPGPRNQHSLEQGTDFLNAWIDAYPNIHKWHNTCKNLVDAGEPVRMVDGRRCFLNGIRTKHTIMCNNIVQGSVLAMKLALWGIYNALPGPIPVPAWSDASTMKF